jgi:hypothetical protein
MSREVCARLENRFGLLGPTRVKSLPLRLTDPKRADLALSLDAFRVSDELVDLLQDVFESARSSASRASTAFAQSATSSRGS